MTMTDATLHRMQAARAGIIRRVLVTLAALAVFRFASIIPIPGLALHDTSLAPHGVLQRLSFMAVGVIAWVSAVTLAELVVLLLPPRVTSQITHEGHANPFAFPIVAFAFAMSALQGYGVAVALEQVRDLVVDPGFSFRLVTSISLMTGTAVAVCLARIIQTAGVGWGFWVLWAALALVNLSREGLQLFAAVGQGMIGTLPALAVCAGVLISVAAVVLLLRARRTMGFVAAEPVVWPVHLYALVVPWIGIGWGIIADGFMEVQHANAMMLPDRPLGAIVATVLIGGIVWIMSARENGRPFWLPTTAVLLTALAASMFAKHATAGLWFPAATLMLASAVGTVIVTTVCEQWNSKPS